MIRCINNHAFSIKFDNNFTLNAMFAKHNSCSRYDGKQRGNTFDDCVTGTIEAVTCEVTITDNKDNVVIFADEISWKYVGPKELAELIFKTSIALEASDINDFDIGSIRKEESWE